jgi:cobalamin biosynthesis protein CobT
MARHTTVSRHLRIGVVALLGAGLFAPALDGALHSVWAPAVAQASAVTALADRGNSTDDGAAATSTPEPSASADRGNGTDDGAATTSTPEPSASAHRGHTTDDQNGTREGSHGRDDGSGDEGVSDEGAVHDGQSGQNDESEVELHHEETNHVNAGSNTFGDDTTPAQSAPQVDR